ncbi:PAS domain S-box-containing protein [Parelusimicrobium proximum]|uniref:PAS domain S-box protein n=1 Tax=Parelusimicrobium proximum TaxID=3228953 RepID=UPI003D1645E5
MSDQRSVPVILPPLAKDVLEKTKPVLDSLPVPALIALASTQTILYTNKEAKNLLGEEKEPLLNKTLQSINIPAEKLQAALSEEDKNHFFCILKTNALTKPSSKVSVAHLQDKSLITVILNPLKAEEVKAENNSGLLEAIISNSPLAFYIRNQKGEIIFWNKQSEKFFGETPSQPNYMQSPGETKLHTAREVQAYKEGKTIEIIEPFVSRNGEVKEFKLIKVPLKMEGKEPVTLTIGEDITESVKQKEEITESRNTLQAILEKIPLGIYATNPDTHEILFINEAAKKMDFAEREDNEKTKYYIQREKDAVLKKKTIDIPEEEYTTKSGNKVLLHIVKTPIFKQNGEPSMVLTLAENITEEKSKETEILKTKNFLQAVVDNLPLALNAKRADGTYILWNKKSEEVFEASSDTVLGKKYFRDQISEEQKEYIGIQDKKVFDSKAVQHIPKELISTSKEGVKIMRTVRTPIFDISGKPDYILSISEDISQEVKMEKQLKESKDKYSILLDNAQEAVMLIEDKKILFANKRAAELFGKADVSEMLESDISDYISDDSKKDFEESFNSVLNNITDSSTEHVAIDTPQNTSKDIEVYLKHSRYMGRKIVLFFASDKTTLNKTVKDLEVDKKRYSSGFEKFPEPILIMSPSWRVAAMNAESRKMFSVNKDNMLLVKNIYLKPMVPLAARKEISKGMPAETDILINPAKMPEEFAKAFSKPTPLHLTFIPIAKKESRSGDIQTEYLVQITDPNAKKKETSAAPEQFAPVAVSEELLSDSEMLSFNMYMAKCATNGNILNVSKALASLIGKTEAELTNTPLYKIFNPDEKMMLAKDLVELYRTGVINQRPYNLQIKKDKYLSVEINAVRTQDNGFLLSVINTAPKYQMLHIIEELEEKNNALINTFASAVLTMVMEDGIPKHIVSVEGDVKGVLGYKKKEMLDLKISSLFDKSVNAEEHYRKVMSPYMSELRKKGRISFTERLYNKNNEAVLSLISMAKISSSAKELILSISDLGPLMTLPSMGREHKEFETLKKSLPGMLVTADVNGTLLDVHSNSKDFNVARDPESYIGKSIREYLPEGTAENIILAIKESLSVNVPTEITYSIPVKNGENRYYTASISPLAEEQKALALIKEITNERDIEEKLRKLSDVANKGSKGITEYVDDILNFGKSVFAADVGVVIRFSKRKYQQYTVIYTSENNLAIERGMMFKMDSLLQGITDGSIVMSNDIERTELPKDSFFKSKPVKSVMIAPLHLGGEVAGALCFIIAQGSRYSFQYSQEDFMGLLSRFLSFSLELRQADKLVSESIIHLTRTLSYLQVPSVLMDAHGGVAYANDCFLGMLNLPQERVFDGNLFELLTSQPKLEEEGFWAAYEQSNGKTFFITFKQRPFFGSSIRGTWKAHVIKDAQDKVSHFALIYSDDERFKANKTISAKIDI